MATGDSSREGYVAQDSTDNRVSHPQYDSMRFRWQKVRDSIAGDEQMKDRSLSQNRRYLDGRSQLSAIETFEQYLRPTDSMRRNRELGLQRFCDYIYRAHFYPFPEEIMRRSIGLIENQPASIELPAVMEGLIYDSTTGNESLLRVLSLINTQQIQVSRIGILLEPSNEDGKPFNLAGYHAEAIVDWHQVRSDDSDLKYDWIKLYTGEKAGEKPIYLILGLDESGYYYQYQTTNENTSYGDLMVNDGKVVPDSIVYPMSSEKMIEEIPFVIINSTTIGADVQKPFIEPIVDGSISLFRADAHYRDALHWGGESTLFSRGYGLGNKPLYVGNGAHNESSEQYASAEYVTMGTNGIAPRKDAVRELLEYCISLGVDLLNKGTESGTALNIRSNIKTASLKTLSLTGAEGLEIILRIGAEWLGASSDEVKINANTKFADVQYAAADFVQFASLVSSELMSKMDMYELQKRNGITFAKTFEDWLKELSAYPVDNPDAE